MINTWNYSTVYIPLDTSQAVSNINSWNVDKPRKGHFTAFAFYLDVNSKKDLHHLEQYFREKMQQSKYTLKVPTDTLL